MNVNTNNKQTKQQLSLNATMRNIWADNADACSVQYAGTGALKTDFTRTGKRTFAGLLQDGVNSMVRYWKNNFMDGKRQVRGFCLLSCFWFVFVK